MTLRFAPEAAAEYVAAAEYYERQVPGLGAAYVTAIELAVQRIVTAPSRWRVVDGDVRRCLVERFPYGIY